LCHFLIFFYFFLKILFHFKRENKKRLAAFSGEAKNEFSVSFYLLSRYVQAASAAIAPSEAAVATWRTDFVRQSPATKTPGVFVVQASPETAYPRTSSSISDENGSFCGRRPTARTPGG
jgi:hypothetical protein